VAILPKCYLDLAACFLILVLPSVILLSPSHAQRAQVATVPTT